MKHRKKAAAEKRFTALGAVFEKEFSDYFCNLRFVLVLGILLATCVVGAMGARATIAEFAKNYSEEYIFLYLFTGTNGILPSVVGFLSYLGPIVGVVLGFDAISSERNNGTLSRILSMPIYRDTLINAKALAGIAVIAVCVCSVCSVVAGIGIISCGIMPLAGEVIRLFLFMLFTTLYIAFWLCLSILFSIVFRQATLSALCGIAVWIASTVFVPLIAQSVASAVFPVNAGSMEQAIYQNQQMQYYLLKISPANLFTEAVNIILNPMIRSAGPMSQAQYQGMVAGFLSIPQSLLLIWSQMAGLLALAALCFACAYLLFTKQEIRA